MMHPIEQAASKPGYEKLETLLHQAFSEIKHLREIIPKFQGKQNLNSRNSPKIRGGLKH